MWCPRTKTPCAAAVCPDDVTVKVEHLTKSQNEGLVLQPGYPPCSSIGGRSASSRVVHMWRATNLTAEACGRSFFFFSFSGNSTNFDSPSFTEDVVDASRTRKRPAVDFGSDLCYLLVWEGGNWFTSLIIPTLRRHFTPLMLMAFCPFLCSSVVTGFSYIEPLPISTSSSPSCLSFIDRGPYSLEYEATNILLKRNTTVHLFSGAAPRS